MSTLTTPDLTTADGLLAHYSAVQRRIRDAGRTYTQKRLSAAQGNSGTHKAYRELLESVARRDHRKMLREQKARKLFLISWQQMIELVIAKKHGANIIQCQAPKRHSFSKIIDQVANKHGVTENEIISPRRQKRIVLARQEIAYRCRNETAMSLVDIGRRMGGKDHTTILYGAGTWQRLIDIKNGNKSLLKTHDKNVNWSLVE